MDLLTPRDDEIFTALAERSIRAAINNVEVNVIGRSDLIAMKRIAAAEAQDPAKHLRDLACLEGDTHHST